MKMDTNVCKIIMMIWATSFLAQTTQAKSANCSITNLDVFTHGETYLSVKWSVYDGGTGKDCTSGNMCINDTDECHDLRRYSGTKRFFGLIPGTMYAVSMTTINIDGGEDTATAFGSTMPKPASDVNVTGQEMHALHISIYKPSDPCGHFESYFIIYQSNDSYSFGEQYVSASCTSPNPTNVTLKSTGEEHTQRLRAGTEYWISIQTFSNGLYNSGPDTYGTTLLSPPLSPVLGKVTATSIEVSWTEPVDNYDRVTLNCTDLVGSSHGYDEVFRGDTIAMCTGLMPKSEYSLTLCTNLDGNPVPPACAGPGLVKTDGTEPHSMMPDFGPISGGTLIIIDGKYLDYTVELTLGPMEINMTWINSSQIQTITPAVPADVVGYQLNVTLTTVYGDQIVVPETYEYRPDPVIVEIYPLDTIASGGTTITTKGSYLNSIAMPLIDVTLVNRTTAEEMSTTFQTPCHNTTNSTMLCIIPDLRIKDNPYTGIGNRTISSPELVFYLGFTLDGVEAYTNISEAEGLEKYGILTVYAIPSLGKADGLITYQEGVLLHVEGADMTSGISMDDYIVDIGTGLCVNQELTDNELICTPPAIQPKQENRTESEYHRIVVNIGVNTEHYYGEMLYPKPVNELAIIVGSVVGAVLITVLVAVSILAIRYKKKAENSQETSKETYQEQECPNL